MAIVAAVVDVVRAVEPSEQLQQKAGLVAAAAAEVPKCFVGGGGTKLGGDVPEGRFPRNRAYSGRTRDRTAPARRAGRTPPARADENCCSSRGEIAPPEVAADGALHVGDHRLQALLADLGKMARVR